VGRRSDPLRRNFQIPATHGGPVVIWGRFNLRTRDGQLGFIRANLRELSECASEGFERYGKGAILVDVESHDTGKAMVSYDFMPKHDLSNVITDLEGSHEGRLVRDYDPAGELVVVFAWWEGKTEMKLDSYRICHA
jgi:hypothetical protein